MAQGILHLEVFSISTRYFGMAEASAWWEGPAKKQLDEQRKMIQDELTPVEKGVGELKSDVSELKVGQAALEACMTAVESGGEADRPNMAADLRRNLQLLRLRRDEDEEQRSDACRRSTLGHEPKRSFGRNTAATRP